MPSILAVSNAEKQGGQGGQGRQGGQGGQGRQGGQGGQGGQGRQGGQGGEIVSYTHLFLSSLQDAVKSQATDKLLSAGCPGLEW